MRDDGVQHAAPADWPLELAAIGCCRSYPKSDNRPREGAFAKLAILRRDLTPAEREAIG